MKTSTGNQEQCLNPSAAVSLLHAHTSPIIPRKREAQTTQLHHLSPASPGAPLPCLHAQPSLLQAYFGTKPPPHSAASRQQMSPLGAVWVCVPSPKPPRQCYSKPWHPTICFLLLQSMISAPGWEIQFCCCLSWRDSRTRQNINGERQSCSKRQSRGWNPIPSRTATHPFTRQLGRPAEAPQHQLDSMASKNPTSNAKALLLLVQPHLGAHLQKGCWNVPPALLEVGRQHAPILLGSIPVGTAGPQGALQPQPWLKEGKKEGRASSCWSAACTCHYILLCTLLTDVAANCCVNP